MVTPLKFLNKNPNKSLGIDGSNNARAYLYYRIIQNNYENLTDRFDIYGVKVYVRVLRNRKDDRDEIDVDDIETVLTKISKGERIAPNKMYNLIVFNLKHVV